MLFGRDTLDIEHLRECVYLASTLSFTKTAQRFYITQPVLSKHVSKVESELGIALFLRGKNGVHLTKTGRVTLDRIQRLVEDYDDMIEDIAYLKSGRDVPIRLGYLYGASHLFLPDAIRKFELKHPSSPVNYRSMEINQILDALEEKQINFAITTGMDNLDTDRFDYLDLYPDQLCVVVPKNHEFYDREYLLPNELVGHSIILPRNSFMPEVLTRIKEILAPIWDTIDVKHLIFDLDSIKMSLLVEDDFTIEFEHLRHYFDADSFHFIPLKSNQVNFNVIALWKKADSTDAMRDFAAQLKECAAQAVFSSE